MEAPEILRPPLIGCYDFVFGFLRAFWKLLYEPADLFRHGRIDEDVECSLRLGEDTGRTRPTITQLPWEAVSSK